MSRMDCHVFIPRIANTSPEYSEKILGLLKLQLKIKTNTIDNTRKKKDREKDGRRDSKHFLNFTAAIVIN